MQHLFGLGPDGSRLLSGALHDCLGLGLGLLAHIERSASRSLYDARRLLTEHLDQPRLVDLSRLLGAVLSLVERYLHIGFTFAQLSHESAERAHVGCDAQQKLCDLTRVVTAFGEGERLAGNDIGIDGHAR